MVQAGLGVCLVPAFTALSGARTVTGIDLYHATGANRRIVALLPSQYERLELYSQFVSALRVAGSRVRLPKIIETPPFLKRPGAVTPAGQA
jgi:hypothetical protein